MTAAEINLVSQLAGRAQIGWWRPNLNPLFDYSKATTWKANIFDVHIYVWRTNIFGGEIYLVYKYFCSRNISNGKIQIYLMEKYIWLRNIFGGQIYLVDKYIWWKNIWWTNLWCFPLKSSLILGKYIMNHLADNALSERIMTLSAPTAHMEAHMGDMGCIGAHWTF